jgi:hypothetical protein
LSPELITTLQISAAAIFNDDSFSERQWHTQLNRRCARSLMNAYTFSHFEIPPTVSNAG